MVSTIPLPFWEYFDAISLGVLIVTISILLVAHHKKTGGVLSTISETVAYSSRSSLIFSIVMTGFFPLYYAFLWFWVGPLLRMPNIFYVLLLISAACEILFVWLPAKGRTKTIHKVTAGLVGLTMLVLPLILMNSSRLNTLGEIGIDCFLLITVCLLPILILKKMRRYTFQIEVIYCIAFLAMISLIAHS